MIADIGSIPNETLAVAASDNPLRVLFQYDLGDRQFCCPDFSALQPAHVMPAVQDLLLDFQQVIADVCASATIRYDSLLAPLEAANARLRQGFGAVEHLYRVQDSPALREAYGEAQTRVTQFLSELNQNYPLYQKLKALAAGQSETGANERVLARWLLEFERGGVQLKGSLAATFLENVQQLAALSTQFEQQLLDATQAWALDLSALEAQTQLAGLPEFALVLLRQQALEAGLPGYRITLRYPSYAAVMNFAEDRNLREKLYQAYATRASEFGDAAFDNGPTLAAIMQLRLRNAELLGYRCPAELILLDKMAGNCASVEQFLLTLTAQARPHAVNELHSLEQFAKEHALLERAEPLQAWDLSYISEGYKQHQLGFDSASLKHYFEVEHILGALSQLMEALFGLHFESDSAMPIWHPEVRFYRLVDSGGITIAGFYLDLFARVGKRGGAWMDVCSARNPIPGGLQLPIAHLVCNFSPPAENGYAALNHDELLTLLHEFGHGLHLMLTEVPTQGASGIDGVEWDAIELPSQLMENFAWSTAGLALFARHIGTGTAMPDALVQSLKGSKSMLAGLRIVRQLEFASFDFAIHSQQQRTPLKKIMQQLGFVRAKVSVLQAPAWQRFPHSFSHIFAGGYGAVYYGYLWAEVLSADVFSMIEEMPNGSLADFGARFRKHILAVGGSVPALQAFVALRGRQPEPAKLLNSYGLGQPRTQFKYSA